MSYVHLKCVKEGSRLRVKIITDGYNKRANCQFPKAIRAEGKHFKVPLHAVTVVQRGADKWFYNINKKYIEEIVDTNIKPEKIYEISEECVICMSEPCNMIMVPCGHLCMCSGCSDMIATKGNGKCPICRAAVITRIDKSKLQ